MAPLMVNGNDNEANGTVLATQNGAAGQSTAIQADAAIEIGNHAYQMPNDFAAIAFQQLKEYFCKHLPHQCKSLHYASRVFDKS